ncbi:GNAT family N-acetyltransferase [Streptomyces sp. NPDC005955]|uniref:GNAT family N-acetyltransferase n=1 Tax=Streptomyces sp. NPDC005955 TaxID=3364738 RepID=UPI00369C4A56
MTPAAEAPAAPVPPAAPPRAAGPATDPGPTVELCRDPDAFAALAGAWQRLFDRCHAATPFQHHAWLHSWWQSYGRPGRLRVVLVREAGELVGAAPLTLVRHPFPALVPLGGALADHGDVLLDDARAAPAASALARGIAGAARGAVVDLREVRPGAAAEQVYAAWSGPKRRLADSVCLELPAAPLEELVGRLARPRAQRVRAKLRKLDALGVRSRVVTAGEVPGALAALVALHRLQWQGRKVTPEHLRPRFAAHLERAVVPMVRSGHAAVTEFRLDGEVVAVDVTLLAPGFAGAYLYGAHPGLRERKADVATMLLRSGARLPTRDGTGGPGVLSLLRGDEPYKHHWRPTPVVNQRLLLARRRGAPWLTTALADAGARELVRRVRRAHRERAGARDGTGGGGGAHDGGGA